MKTNKEYPATHSMSTSWYVVDDEGNVGLMDYNENGPVPWGVEQTGCDALVYGHYDDCPNGPYKFNLSEEQLLDLLHKPHKPSEEDSWIDCVVKIDENKRERFVELCGRKDIDCLCISEIFSLYRFDAFDCVKRRKDNEQPSIVGSLKEILDENIVIDVYKPQSHFMSDHWEGETIVHEKEFDNSSYYIFHQPYWTDALPQKMNEPEHPVRIEQVPEEFRRRLHRIPGNFKDINTFQIAEYYPCDTNGNDDQTYYLDGCMYQTSPLPDGNKVYTKTTMYDYEFLPFCPEKDHYHCENKCSDCCSFESCLLTDNPTVLIVDDPRNEIDYSWKSDTDLVLQSAYVTPYFPRFPYKKGTYVTFKDDIKKFMNSQTLSSVYAKSKGYFETIIEDMKPRVILATDNAMDVLKENHKIDSDNITFNGTEYPIYLLSSLNENRDTIEKLSQLPYRGKEHPLVITLEEMEKLVKSGKAIAEN